MLPPHSYSPDGSKLAYTRADTADAHAAGQSASYTWAQTWAVCIVDVASGARTCDELGTADAMPVLVGWLSGGTHLLCVSCGFPCVLRRVCAPLVLYRRHCVVSLGVGGSSSSAGGSCWWWW